MSENLQALFIEQFRLLRRELADIRTVTLAVADGQRRLDRRIDGLERRFEEMKDEIELMVKAELMGRLGNFEMQMEARLDRMAERLDAFDGPPAPELS